MESLPMQASERLKSVSITCVMSPSDAVDLESPLVYTMLTPPLPSWTGRVQRQEDGRLQQYLLCSVLAVANIPPVALNSDLMKMFRSTT